MPMDVLCDVQNVVGSLRPKLKWPASLEVREMSALKMMCCVQDVVGSLRPKFKWPASLEVCHVIYVIF